MTWEEISERIDVEIKIGTGVPKTNGKIRKITKKVGSEIYMRTGVETTAEKYITKEMLQYAYTKIQSGEIFTSKDLANAFPSEYNQGDCVFSMTGGIFELLNIARYIPRKGYILK